MAEAAPPAALRLPVCFGPWNAALTAEERATEFERLFQELLRHLGDIPEGYFIHSTVQEMAALDADGFQESLMNRLAQLPQDLVYRHSSYPETLRKVLGLFRTIKVETPCGEVIIEHVMPYDDLRSLKRVLKASFQQRAIPLDEFDLRLAGSGRMLDGSSFKCNQFRPDAIPVLVMSPLAGRTDVDAAELAASQELRGARSKEKYRKFYTLVNMLNTGADAVWLACQLRILHEHLAEDERGEDLEWDVEDFWEWLQSNFDHMMRDELHEGYGEKLEQAFDLLMTFEVIIGPENYVIPVYRVLAEDTVAEFMEALRVKCERMRVGLPCDFQLQIALSGRLLDASSTMASSLAPGATTAPLLIVTEL